MALDWLITGLLQIYILKMNCKCWMIMTRLSAGHSSTQWAFGKIITPGRKGTRYWMSSKNNQVHRRIRNISKIRNWPQDNHGLQPSWRNSHQFLFFSNGFKQQHSHRNIQVLVICKSFVFYQLCFPSERTTADGWLRCVLPLPTLGTSRCIALVKPTPLDQLVVGRASMRWQSMKTQQTSLSRKSQSAGETELDPSAADTFSL